MNKQSQTSCGCVWERTPEYGDVVVVQCAKHGQQTKKAERAARLRREGKVK